MTTKKELIALSRYRELIRLLERIAEGGMQGWSVEAMVVFNLS